jgi:hypothetical protein
MRWFGGFFAVDYWRPEAGQGDQVFIADMPEAGCNRGWCNSNFWLFFADTRDGPFIVYSATKDSCLVSGVPIQAPAGRLHRYKYP